MPVKQAVQSQSLPPASLPCIITFLAWCVSGSCIIRMQAERSGISSFLPSAGKRPPSFPGKGVCTRSNGPIKCLDYSMCRYLSAVLVVARR